MNLSVGIVGLPNVGKSTLFNALLKKQQALAANYPFATIEPNVGIVPVPDERLIKLAVIVGGGDPHVSLREAQDDSIILPPIKPATVEFVDIAGLVKGASEGAGLGNKFLSHIREVQIIAHVVRAFEDENVVKEGSIDAKSDYETIQTELILADLASIQNSESKIKNNDPRKPLLEKLLRELNAGKPARDVKLSEEEQEAVRELFLLSAKPEIVVLNVSEEDYNPERIETISQKYAEILNPIRQAQGKQVQNDNDANIVVICAKIESELAALSEDEQVQYLKELGLKQSGLERLIQSSYEKLGLISFLTAGEKEVRAWTVQKNTKAVDAAGVIHTDFTKKFIKAEVVSFEDFVQNNGWKGSREAGKARLEGRDYIVRDGDVIEFKIGT